MESKKLGITVAAAAAGGALLLTGCSSADSGPAESSPPPAAPSASGGAGNQSPSPAVDAEGYGGDGEQLVVGKDIPAGTYSLAAPVTEACEMVIDQGGGLDLDFGDASVDLISTDPLTAKITSGNPRMKLRKGWKVTSQCGPLVTTS